MKTYYKITCIFYVHYWFCGEGTYKAESLEGEDLKELIKKAKKMLKDGSLDSGMGYESLIGALLTIEKIKTITKNGKDYQNSEFENLFIGNLTDKQIEFLDEIWQYNL